MQFKFETYIDVIFFAILKVSQFEMEVQESIE